MHPLDIRLCAAQLVLERGNYAAEFAAQQLTSVRLEGDFESARKWQAIMAAMRPVAEAAALMGGAHITDF